MSIPTGARLCIGAALLAISSAATEAGPMRVVKVATPAVNCVFDKACTIAAKDSIGMIPVPGLAGEARLLSRSFQGAAGSPGAGRTGYQYRVDLSAATGKTTCVTLIKLDFGPVAALDYDKDGTPDGAYVVDRGGPGSIGIKSVDRGGTIVTFTFEKPICGGASPGEGGSSLFFGLASPGAPEERFALVEVTGGDQVGARSRVAKR